LQFASLVNIAGKVRGVQFGVVNIADENDYPIGLVNLIKKGRKSIAVTCNETGSMTVSFRSGGKVTYGIVGYGYNFKAGKKTYLAEGGLGIRLPVASKFGINNEFKIETFHSSDNATCKAGYSLLPAYQFTPHIEIFAGPSINYMYSDDINHADMFPSHSLWKKRDASTRQQVFIGYQLGVQYVF
jgi:hypothetical protein